MSTRASKIDWETYEGENHAYLDNDWQIEISAPTRYSKWGDVDSSVRQWFIHDADNNLVAKGAADDLRAAKKAATAALEDHVK
jgi:hypothetical protein